MEPGVRLFLKTIVQSMSLGMLWLLLNTMFGIKYGLLFFEDGFTIWNGLYYIGMLVSFVFIFRHLVGLWKKVPRFGDEESEDL